MTMQWRQRADVQAQSAREGRSHRIRIKFLAFDLTGLDDVIGQGHKAGLIAHGHSNIGQTPEQHALSAAHVG
jgi:hypothetical protein